MKCIGYVSDFVTRQTGAKIPYGISEIFSVSQASNRKFNITGVLSYKREGYFQVIEGEDDAVNQLIANITADSRHENVTILFDFPVSKRSFPDWFIRLQTSLNRDLRFNNFMEKNSHIISSLSDHERRLFEPFFHLNKPGTTTTTTTTTTTYFGKKIKLLTWPDFAIITPSSENISVCGKLISKVFTYEELLSGRDFGTQEELDSLLMELEKTNALVLSDSPKETVVKLETETSDSSDELLGQHKQTLESNKSSSFYSKMKAFLKRGIK